MSARGANVAFDTLNAPKATFAPSGAAAPRVVVVGDLAVDVLVTPSTPRRPGGDVPARITTCPGGAGASTATWLAARGMDVSLVTRVGDDAAGRAAVANLRAAGVRPVVAIDAQAATATVVVLVDGADRTMLSDRRAAARLCVDDLPPFEGIDHLHLSGYVLLDPASGPAGRAALSAARAAGISTSLDPQTTGDLAPAHLRLMQGVDLLLPNEDELAALTGSADPASATTLLGTVGAVAVTRGAAGASWIDPDGVRSVEARAVAVVDPTGAGDAFDAGLIAARLTGAAPEAALAAGCAAAAEVISRCGARPDGPR
ncbi:MAG: PfkB domain protein [Pseudonocardia sp.]|jgi:sugar/nucleoside kinase (ribokinase family)|nr:PfkB domain protein [Pseudonocardia sp.]